MIRQNRAIIRKMDDQASVDIETDKLKSLCDIAEKYGGAAKTIRCRWWRLRYHYYSSKCR